MKPTTVVIGASDNPARYSHEAVKRLRSHGYPVRALGIRPGQIEDINIETNRPQMADVDTVTLYVGPTNLLPWRDYILSLKPRRIIFNPGTEYPEFKQEARKAGIQTMEACTLVMLSIGNYDQR